MSFIGGYQSNVNLNDMNIVGDFPIDHSIGGFGIGLGVNNYAITVNTAITQYRQGLLLQIVFAEANTGPVQVNVSNRGLKALKKPTPGGLVDLDPGEINNTKIYLLVYDGQGFQVANLGSNASAVVDANEDVKGIAQIATGYEVRDGIDNNKIVTPLKLANYVADKITGLWKDKGLINCSANPNYPAGIAGEAYTVNGAGKIGGAAGQNVGLRDVIYCNANNPGGTDAAVGNNWTILQANLEAATELIAGYVRLATQDEVSTGESLTTAVSPRRLKDLLDGRHANEDIYGLIRIATQADVNLGAEDGSAVTALKLKNLLDFRVASQAVSGLISIASQAEMSEGLIDTKAVTPFKLARLLSGLILSQLGTAIGSVLPKAGAGNTADGIYTVVTGGQNNKATGPYSVAGGLFAAAALFNEWAKAGGAFFNTPGSSQNSILNLLASVATNGSAVPLTCDGAAPGANNRWLPPNNSIQQFMIQFTITQNTGFVGTTGQTYSGIYEGTVRNQAGVVNWVGGAATLREIHQDVGFTPTLGFTFSPGEITLYVNGMVERSLFASATVYITQTKFNLNG